jgi:hypothetical protein
MPVFIFKVALMLLAAVISLVVVVTLLIEGWRALQAILQVAHFLILGIVLAIGWLLRLLLWLLTAPIALFAGPGTAWQRMGAELKEEGLAYLRGKDWRQL